MRLRLGEIYYKEKNYDESLKFLIRIDYSEFNTPNKITLFDILTLNYLEKEIYLKALYWLTKEYEIIEKTQTYEKILNLINQKLNEEDLKKALNLYKRKFPQDLIYIKLIKFYYNENSFTNSKKYLEEFKINFPNHSSLVELNALFFGEKKQINIAVVLPLTQKYADYGISIKNGFEYGREYFNKISEANLIIKYFDQNTESIETIFEEFDKIDNLSLILGSITQTESEKLAKFSREKEIPVITFTQKENITNESEYIFRYFLTKKSQSKNLVNWATFELGIKRFAILAPDNSYGQEFSRFFEEEVIKNEGETLIEYYPAGEKDFRNIIKKIKSFDFEAIFLPDSAKAVSLIVPTLLYSDVTGVQLLGTNVLNNEEFVSRTGKDYVQGMILTDGFCNDSKNVVLTKLKDDYNKKFEKELDYFSLLGYEIIEVIVQSLRDMKSINKEDLKNSLINHKIFTSISGEITLNEAREFEKQLCILTIDDGEIVKLN